MTTLHKLRRAHGLSLSELALRTAIPMRQLAAYEYDEQPLSATDQQRLAAVFAVPPGTLSTTGWISSRRVTKAVTAALQLPFSMHLLLGMVLLLYIARLMILPFLAVYFTATLRFAAWQVASILTVMLVCQRALPTVGGLLGDRLGHVRVVIVGLVATGLGVVGFGLVQGFWWLLSAAVLVGSGGALIDPSINAVFAGHAPPQRALLFTRYNQMLNVATMVGPVGGSYLIAQAPALLFYMSGALFVGIAAAIFAFRHHYVTLHAQDTLQNSLRHVWQMNGFLTFLAIMTLFWIMFAQLTVALPLHAFRIGQAEQSVSTLFVVSGFVGVVLLAGLQNVFRQVAPLPLLRIGVVCVGLGLSLVPLGASMVWLLVCVVIYTVGETLVLTSADIAVAEFSANRHTGTFYGLFDLSWAIGGALGNYLGTWMMAETAAQGWPWLLFGILGLLTCALLHLCSFRPTMHALEEMTA